MLRGCGRSYWRRWMAVVVAGCAGIVGFSGAAEPTEKVVVDTIPLRGYGKVSFAGTRDGATSLGVFTCESPEKAQIVASKYWADLLNYGAVAKVADAPSTLAIRHGGLWRLGLDGDRVMILTAPDAAALAAAAANAKADGWTPVPENAYPRYLDNFDNAALAIWWRPSTKSEEEMAWFKANPVIANFHDQTIDVAFAPNVFDNAAPRNAAAQVRTAGKPYRTMLWTGGGKSAWFSWMNLPGDEHETFIDGFTGRNYHEAGGYYSNHIATDFLNDLQLHNLVTLMDAWNDDPDLLAWMEPHGEFGLVPLNRPPQVETRFPAYLRDVRGYTPESLSAAWGETFADLNAAKLPDPAYFAGRRGEYIDLDDAPWKWWNATLTVGAAAGFADPDFDDAAWFPAKRTDKRLLAFVQEDAYDINDKDAITASLWARFDRELPADFLERHPKVYLHVMPMTHRNNRNLALWVNGEEVVRDLVDKHVWSGNNHSEVEIGRFLRPGRNTFVLHSQGGRIAYRVFLSPLPVEVFPFADVGLNHRYLDWRAYLRHEKFQTMEQYLQAMRALDPNRPIKVMTPNQWMSDAFDLFEKYGAHPQLTGETDWYRPMHYKGYTQLRNRYSTSEPGSPVNNTRSGQQMYAMAFFEAQDGHDYGFDFTRDFWSFPEVVQWWADNAPLLATFGKTDLVRNDVGLLRDTAQDSRYDTGKIWNWDLSRGPLPALGIVPVLVDGADLEKGLADGKVKVMFDCATTVMDEALVEAVKRYVERGGVFIAQHHTGQHAPYQRDAWPLATAFGLTAALRDPDAELVFAEDQDLFPSLRGQSFHGAGASINHLDTEEPGSLVSLTGPTAQAVANWKDGNGMAIASVTHGKGRFIFLGSPFYLRFKDTHGKWLNDEARQAIVRELLASLGIAAETRASDPTIWFERRASKNGLYDVYFAGAMGIRGRDWTLDDRIVADLAAQRPAAASAIDAAAAGLPDVPTRFEDGLLSFGSQAFGPYQIRQFAVLRENAGLEGPAHWLRQQEKGWYALPPVAAFDREKVAATTRDFARKLGEDGLDISRDWKVSLDDMTPGWIRSEFPAAWATAHMGSWLEQGFPQGTQRVRYRKVVEIPEAWRAGDARVFLAFDSHFSGGISDRGRVWVNGQPLVPDTGARFRLELPEDVWREGRMELAFEVTAAPGPRRSPGPMGTMYLHKLPKPDAVLSLDGEWTRIKTMLEDEGTLTVPYTGKVFGMRRTVAVPAEWEGKLIRLVVDEPFGKNWNHQRLGIAILNREHFLSESFMSPGPRVDAKLVAGAENEIALFGPMADARGTRIVDVEVGSIRLEAYSLTEAP